MNILVIGDSLTQGVPGVAFTKWIEDEVPNIQLTKFAFPGETIQSLEKRLSSKTWQQSFDQIYCWIGINDIYSRLLQQKAQPIVADATEFKEYYQQVIAALLPITNKLILVSPISIGEGSHPLNEMVLEFALVIKELAIENNIETLDLTKLFHTEESASSSDYLSTNIWVIMKDALFIKGTKRVDRLSKKRGLTYTLDGIHLNSTGSRLVADAYIRQMMT